MCGIVGKYYFRADRYNSSDLDEMMAAIAHRGPDDSGTFCDGRIALGFQRLSIIDTAGGHQPLLNETGAIVLVANGEIYNYRELRKQLEARGHRFRSNSDCEVIVHLYEDYGESLLQHLNGMFAFCLYDTKQQTALIARDRLGIKPMYVAQTADLVAFSSEIKGILATREFEPERETGVLKEYLLFRYLAGTRTFFAGVSRLTPGKYLKLTPGGHQEFTYWRPTYRVQDRSESQSVEVIGDTLSRAVRRQMVSDVPLGTLLSGGVDSGMVSAVAGAAHDSLQGFTVGFNDPQYDESAAAGEVARQSGLHHHIVRIETGEFADNLKSAIWFNDEPLTHANSVQIYLICRYAREYVKVLLTGEGADELFAGYPRYYLAEIGSKYARLPRFAQWLGKEIVGSVPGHKAAKLRPMLGRDPKSLVYWNSGFVTPNQLAGLFEDPEPGCEARQELLESIWQEERTVLDNLLVFEQATYLQPILSRQDKMSMAASIESRVPMLDNEVVDLAMTIPASRKLRRLQPKHLLKKAAVRVIPRDIVYGRKQGFGVPLGDWLRRDARLWGYTEGLLDVDWLHEGLNRKALETMVREHGQGIRDHGEVLWPLVNYLLWSDMFFAGSGTSRASESPTEAVV